MQKFLQFCPPQELRVQSDSLPFLLYTDASDVSESRKNNSEQVASQELELLVAPIALSTWKSMLSGSRCLHFVDNDSASACLVVGYSPKSDSCGTVPVYWLQASETKTDLYIDRVESKSNMSDGPSRFDYSLMSRLQAPQVEPMVPVFSSDHSISFCSSLYSLHLYAALQLSHNPEYWRVDKSLPVVEVLEEVKEAQISLDVRGFRTATVKWWQNKLSPEVVRADQDGSALAIVEVLPWRFCRRKEAEQATLVQKRSQVVK